MTLSCQWPAADSGTKSPCENPVVASIGLPGPHAIFVCQVHFQLWQQRDQK